jgi:hypothetical protein
MHQSSSTRKQQKRKSSTTNLLYLKNYYDKTTFKVDENGKVIADKKIRRFNN